MPGNKVYGEVQPPIDRSRTYFGGQHDHRARMETAYNNAINPRVLMPTEFQKRPERHADASYWRTAADSYGHEQPVEPADEHAKHAVVARKKKKKVRLAKKKSPKRATKKPAPTLLTRVENHIKGTVYDLAHFAKLPGKTAATKIRYACTRDERGWTLAGIGLIIAILICVVVAIAQSGKSRSLLRGGDGLGSSTFRRAPMIDIVE